jgi:hypothetical protein
MGDWGELAKTFFEGKTERGKMIQEEAGRMVQTREGELEYASAHTRAASANDSLRHRSFLFTS